MSDVLLRIDPVHSPVWVSPTRLRFGIDRPIVVLDDVGRPEELIVTALERGARREALVVIGEQVGMPSSRVDELIDRLAEVLLPPRRRSAPRVALERTEAWPDDDSGLARLVGEAVRRAGARVVDRDGIVDAAVVLAPFAVPPRLGAYWLSRDVPLLPVVAGPAAVEVGPLVIAGRTACLNCIELRRRDDDPDRVVLTAQLTATRRATSLAVPPVPALIASSVLTTALLDLFSPTAELESDQPARASIVGRDGSVTLEPWPPHPRCSCRDPRGNGTAVVRSIGAARVAPRTAADQRALA